MRLTTRTNLAMRTLMFCAVNPGRIVRKHEVAEACGASENHLAQVIHLLARQNFLKPSVLLAAPRRKEDEIADHWRLMFPAQLAARAQHKFLPDFLVAYRI